MQLSNTHEQSTIDPQVLAHERRKNAAWIDYLDTIRSARPGEYEHIERVAWARLQRRLERNDARVNVRMHVRR